jgi:hypothetical protein
LQGRQGTQGTTGSQGTQGLQGLQGRQGTQGLQGTQGTIGSQGLQGLQGRQGTQGTQGTQGLQGVQGRQGIQGSEGNFGGATFDYTFDTNTADSDPGTGKLKFNSSNITIALNLYIDDEDDNATDIQPFLRTIDDSTSTIKGHFRISNRLNASDFALFTISSLVEKSGYFDVSCAYVSGSAVAFDNGEDIIITFARTGDKGDTGTQGLQGRQGTQGLQGLQGRQGTQGLQGLQGRQGTQGLQGLQGRQGTQGLQGVQGQFGGTGLQGSQGTQGLQGTQGAQGLQGRQGTQGTQGLQGLQGQISPVAGSANQIVFKDASNTPTGSNSLTYTGPVAGIGTVGIGTIIKTVHYDSLNTGTLSWEGSAGQLFSITNNLTTGSIFSVNDVSGIPSIDVNADGTVALTPFGGNIGVGLTNPTQKLDVNGTIRLRNALYDVNNQVGAATSVLLSTGIGVSWTPISVAALQGLQGSQGTQGLQGLQGRQGTQGTQGTQGLQGLQGRQGTQGTQGTQGLQGLQGRQGTQGTTGSQGTQGTTGSQGVQGLQGLQGLQGRQGVQGLQGLQGRQGTQGLQGLQGRQGTQGLQGLQGRQGTQGLQGLQGRQGTQGLQGLQGTSGVNLNKSVVTYTATSGQTTFSVTYTVGFVDVYLNGVRLSESQYTATNGTSIILATGASLGDVIDLVVYNGGTLGAQGTQGTAGSSVTVSDDTATNATRYVLFDDITSGTVSTVNVSSTKLTFNPSTGQLTAVDFNSTSDRNLKENIETLSNSIETLEKINPVRFTWKDNGKVSYGVIAQEIEKILPELVKNDSDHKSVSYIPLIAFLIDVVKKHEIEIRAIKKHYENL